jgi:hypothetical protein
VSSSLAVEGVGKMVCPVDIVFVVWVEDFGEKYGLNRDEGKR